MSLFNLVRSVSSLTVESHDNQVFDHLVSQPEKLLEMLSEPRLRQQDLWSTLQSEVDRINNMRAGSIFSYTSDVQRPQRKDRGICLGLQKMEGKRVKCTKKGFIVLALIIVIFSALGVLELMNYQSTPADADAIEDSGVPIDQPTDHVDQEPSGEEEDEQTSPG